MSSRFADHEHGIPETGVPYWPAWDHKRADQRSDASDETCVAFSSYLPSGMLLRARVAVGPAAGEHTLLDAPAIGHAAVISTERGYLVAAPVLGDNGRQVSRRIIEPNGRIEELPAIAFGAVFVESVRLAEGGDETFYAIATGDGTVTVRGDDNREIFRSPTVLHCARPAIHAGSDSRVACAYDGWNGSRYDVYVDAGVGPVSVSDGLPGWHVFADVLFGADGALWVTWVRITDIRNEQGVIDSRNEILLARLSMPGSGRAVGLEVTARGVVDDLSHGLIDTAPDPEGVWGYLGRRRHPMLLNAGSTPVLIWEQKRDHHGATRKNVGVLWERELLKPRRISAQEGDEGSAEPNTTGQHVGTEAAEFVGPATVAACGTLWYETPGSKASPDRDYLLAGFRGAYTDDRQIVLLRRGEGSQTAAPRYPATKWAGWHSVDLPIAELPAGHQTKRPTLTVGGRTYSLYWFDLHCHSALSADAEGEIDECFRTAAYKAQIDGMVVTDNDHYVVPLNQAEWKTNCEAVAEHYEPGLFVPILGYEWTSRPFVNGKQIVDHRSVLLRDAPDDIVRWNEADADSANLYALVEAHGGIVHAHHQNWNLTGHSVEANIEAASSWDAYVHREPAIYHAALASGKRIGLIGGSDEHRRNPGLGGSLTGIWAEELTQESVLEALKAHRCFATSGRKAVIAFTCGDVPVGGVARGADQELSIRIDADVAPEAVFLIRDGEVLRQWSDELSASFSADVHETGLTGSHWYYVKAVFPGIDYQQSVLPSNLQQAVGPFAWTSPIWVEA